jgi:hypothetical protein
MKTVSWIALCLSSFVALGAVACSGAPDPAPTSSSKKASTAGDSTKTPTGSNAPTGNSPSNPTTPAPSTPLSDTAACGKKADAATCSDCCLAGTPKALDAADQAEGDCMCAAAACLTQCTASVCSATDNMNQPTADCMTCLDAHQQECGAKFQSVCNADAACKAADSCLVTQCAPLEKMTGGSSGSSSGGFAGRSSSFSFSARVTAARSADQP